MCIRDRSVAVYWALGRVDPPEAWPASLPLPKNVHVFPAGRAEAFIHRHDDQPLARLIGVSRSRGGGPRDPIRRILSALGRPAPQDADHDRRLPDGELFTIAVAHGKAKADALRAARRSRGRAVDYWALGGRHSAQTLLEAPQVARYPGSTQGRQPDESGPHGCTLVDVDGQGGVRTSMIPTDVIRWHHERIVLQPATTRGELESQLHGRAAALREALSGKDVLVAWTIAGDGPLVAELRRGKLAAELLASLRKAYGFGPPSAWSVSLTVEAPSMLPPEWYEQETILGDFLREIRRCQMNPDEPLDLEPFLSDEQLAGTLGACATIADPRTREQTLREAAMLGVDLLSGEGPLS